MTRAFGDLGMTTFQEMGWAYIPADATLMELMDAVLLLGVDPRDVRVHDRPGSSLTYLCFHGPQREADGVIHGRYCSMERRGG